MKKLMIATVALAVAAMGLQTAKAGDREWATVGKVLTGVAVGAVIANAVDCGRTHVSVTYSSGAPVCVPAPVVCAPPRVVHAPAPRVVYVPAPVIVHQHPVHVVTVRGHGRHERDYHDFRQTGYACR